MSKLRTQLLLNLALAIAMSVVGCAKKPTTVTKVVVVYEGASVRDVDEVVAAPLLFSLNGMPGLIDIQAHSYDGRVEVFLVLEKATSTEEIRQRVDTVLDTLPESCQIDSVDHLPPGHAIPPPAEGDVPELAIQLKSDAILAHDLSFTQVRAAVFQVLDQLEDLPAAAADTRITIDKREFTLSELADVRAAKVPKCIPRSLTMPPDLPPRETID